MFGIGSAEMMIIAVVALVVLGPERLPEVMRKVGQTYRQMRQMSDQLIGEARAQWEAGMQEVDSVSSTLTDSWNQSTSDAPPGPPPRLLQVGTPLEAPATAAAAGPSALPAWYRESKPEVEPYDAAYPEAPTVLARQLPSPYDPVVVGLGSPSLMGPSLTEDDLTDVEDGESDAPDVDVAAFEDLYAIPEGVGESGGANGSVQNGLATEMPDSTSQSDGQSETKAARTS